jgi:hypothetical protein
MSNKTFWSDFFGLTSENDFILYQGLKDCELDLMLGQSGYGVSIRFFTSLFDLELTFVSPSSLERVVIGVDGSHAYPYTLRWVEVDLICRAIAAQDPQLPHPGLPLLFLLRFAPICIGDDVDLIVSMVDAALEPLRFSHRNILDVLTEHDARDAGFRWRYDNVIDAWCLQVYRDYTSGRSLYSFRGMAAHARSC